MIDNDGCCVWLRTAKNSTKSLSAARHGTGNRDLRLRLAFALFPPLFSAAFLRFFFSVFLSLHFVPSLCGGSVASSAVFRLNIRQPTELLCRSLYVYLLMVRAELQITGPTPAAWTFRPQRVRSGLAPNAPGCLNPEKLWQHWKRNATRQLQLRPRSTFTTAGADSIVCDD